MDVRGVVGLGKRGADIGVSLKKIGFPEIRRVMNDMLSAFRQRILSIPTKAAPRLMGITELAVIQDILRKEVHEGLSELADYNAEAFYRQSKDRLVLDDGGAEHGKSEASRRVRVKK